MYNQRHHKIKTKYNKITYKTIDISHNRYGWALDTTISDWCEVYQRWVRIPSRNSKVLSAQKYHANTVGFNFQTSMLSYNSLRFDLLKTYWLKHFYLCMVHTKIPFPILKMHICYGQCRLNAWAHWAVAREPHEHRGPCLSRYIVYIMCLMFKHWFCWKYQYNKYMFNFYSCEWLCR